jgi:VanZ family protein
VTRPVSSAVPLALLWVALIVYASLYPFAPWREGAASDVAALFELPWAPQGVSRFELWSNVAGYLPLGALLFVAGVRHGQSPRLATVLALAGAALLSYAMEALQHFVSRRVPSSLDLLLNSGGAAAGVLLAAALWRLGAVRRWHALRERWFVAGSAGAIALLLLWPVALLFPQPVPFGLGQVFGRLRELAAAALADTPWEVAVPLSSSGLAQAPLRPATETLAMALGLLAPCLLAYTIARPGLRRVLLLTGGVALGFAAMTLSTALNFGPEHALAWLTPTALPALVVALATGVALAWLPHRLAAGVGLVVTTALIALVAQAPTDPYYAESLLAWEQGRFIRFHGIAQWVGWLWPYAVIAVLLGRLAGRD